MAELQGRMSSREFSEWLAFAQVEPFGLRRGDLQAGVVAATVANAHRDAKQKPTPFEPGDFVLRFSAPGREDGGERAAPRQSLGQQVAMVEMLKGMFGGRG